MAASKNNLNLARRHNLLGLLGIVGGGGGGKGGGGAVSQAHYEQPDTLRSISKARVVHALSEGPIKGPVDAAGAALDADNLGKGVFLDETPVQNGDGDFNFKNVKMGFVAGTANQDYLPGFPSSEAEVAVGVRAKEADDFVARTLTTGVDAVRVTVKIPGLVFQDPATGDVRGYSVSYAVDVNDNGGGWVNKVNKTINDKGSSPYLISHRIDLDTAGPYQVRVRRVSVNPAKSNIANETWFESYTEITDVKLRHPFLAKLGLEIDAVQFSSIPKFAIRLGGRIISIPSNYDPVARTYTGSWDGTFIQAYTDNPAWVWRDILTNKRYGLGRYITAAAVDKWALYAIAKIADTSVPDGRGGFEPLYRIALCLEEAVDAFQLIVDLASVFHGLAYWGSGTYTAVADVASDAVAQFNNQNVEKGEFEYPGTSKLARHTVCYVRWNDPDDFYRPKWEYVPDEEGLLKYGVHATQLTAVGCISRAQAIRRGRHLLVTERLATAAIRFRTGLDSAFVRPGQVFKTLDSYRAGKPFGGRVHSATTTTVTLDRDLVVEAGKTYSISVVTPDGVLVEKNLTDATGAHRTVHLASALSGGQVPVVESDWIVKSSTLSPSLWTCVGVKEVEGANVLKFEIVGVQYSAGKFDEIVNGVVIEDPPTSELTNGRLVKPPGTITITPENSSTPIKFTNFLSLSWVASDDQYLRGYRVYWRFEGGPWAQLPESGNTTARIETVGSGLYEFRVVAVNTLGRESGPSTNNYTLGSEAPINNATVTGLEIFEQGNDTTFEGRDVKFVWRLNSPYAFELGAEPQGADSGQAHPLFRDYRVTIRDWESFDLVREEFVLDRAYVYTFEKNAEDGRRVPHEDASTNARRKFRVVVQVRDRFNQLSAATSILVENPAPAKIVPVLDPTLQGVIVKNPVSEDLDFVGYLIHASATPGFTPTGTTAGVGTCVYQGPDPQVTIKLLATGAAYYFKVAAYDAFGTSDLNYSDEWSATPRATLDTVAPAVPVGLALTTDIVINPDGGQRVVVRGTWTPNTEEDVESYTYRWKEASAGPFAWNYGSNVGVNSVAAEFSAKPNVLYEMQVQAADRDANASNFSASVTITSARDTTLPAAPTNLVLTAGIRLILLEWDNAGDDDLLAVDIYKNSVNSMPGTPYKTESAAPGTKGAFVDTNVTQGVAVYYWLKSRDTSDNVSAAALGPQTTTPGVAQSADLADFAVGLTKRFNATIAPSGDIWTDNSPASGRIAWNAHTIYYQGASYSVAAGNTPVGDRYVIWDASNPTVYSSSATNPTLTDTQFVIATNLGGAHDLAWNAIANLLVKSAHIDSMVVDKLDSGTFSAKTIVVGTAGTTNSSIIQSWDFSSGSAGWRIRGADAEFNNILVRGFAAVLGQAAPVSGAGLYLGSDKIGYYNGSAWRSYIDSSGNMFLGGVSGALQFTAGTGALIITGSIQATSTIDGVTASAVGTGATRANAGLDNAGKLITAVLPGATIGASPASAGLYLGSDYMGFYSSGWKTFMDSSGNFYLGGTSGALTWNAATNTLAISGNATFSGTTDIGASNSRTIIDSSQFKIGTAYRFTYNTGAAANYFQAIGNDPIGDAFSNGVRMRMRQDPAGNFELRIGTQIDSIYDNPRAIFSSNANSFILGLEIGSVGIGSAYDGSKFKAWDGNTLTANLGSTNKTTQTINVTVSLNNAGGVKPFYAHMAAQNGEADDLMVRFDYDNSTTTNLVFIVTSRTPGANFNYGIVRFGWFCLTR